jgi:polysaccharide export outer membrane protein
MCRRRGIVVLVVAVGLLLLTHSPLLAQIDDRYRVKPADVLEIQYRYTPEFSQTVTVGPDGYVSLQLLGSVRVGGLTVDEAHALVLEGARQRLRDPEVALVVKEHEKRYVTVTGQVVAPGKIEIKGTLTALEAIAMAGGLRNDAKQSQVILFRRSNPEEYETQVLDVKNLMSKSGVHADLDLRPNDLLLVPQDRVSKVDRVVKLLNLGLYLNAAALLGL